MQEIRSLSLWNNPEKVLRTRGTYFKAPDRALSQAQATTPAPAPAPARGIPTGVYVAGGVLVAAVIGIVAL